MNTVDSLKGDGWLENSICETYIWMDMNVDSQTFLRFYFVLYKNSSIPTSLGTRVSDYLIIEYPFPN